MPATTTVYPACAGIDPLKKNIATWVRGLPRMRGDRPISAAVSISAATFTPHARGSTYGIFDAIGKVQVYPACAGIDRAE